MTTKTSKPMIKITKPIVKKVLSLIDAGLTSGLGRQEPGQMCVEAAVCCALGLPHSDNPPCVGSAVRSFKISLNDCNWSSDAARAAGMRKLAVAQLGSDVLDQSKFADLQFLRGVHKLMPIVFRKAAPELNEKDKTAFLKIADDCFAVVPLAEAQQLVRGAYASAYACA